MHFMSIKHFILNKFLVNSQDVGCEIIHLNEQFVSMDLRPWKDGKSKLGKWLGELFCDGCRRDLDFMIDDGKYDADVDENIWLSLKIEDYQLCNSCHKNNTYSVWEGLGQQILNLQKDFVPVPKECTFYRPKYGIAITDNFIKEYKLPDQLSIEMYVDKILKLSVLWFLGDHGWMCDEI
jgi:hypothetical protein